MPALGSRQDRAKRKLLLQTLDADLSYFQGPLLYHSESNPNPQRQRDLNFEDHSREEPSSSCRAGAAGTSVVGGDGVTRPLRCLEVGRQVEGARNNPCAASPAALVLSHRVGVRRGAGLEPHLARPGVLSRPRPPCWGALRSRRKRTWEDQEGGLEGQMSAECE